MKSMQKRERNSWGVAVKEKEDKAIAGRRDSHKQSMKATQCRMLMRKRKNVFGK